MAAGDEVRLRPDHRVIGPLKSLRGITAAGVGRAFNLGSAHDSFTVQIVAAGTTAATVKLQGALMSSGQAGSTAVWRQIGADIAWDSTVGPKLTRVSGAATSTALVAAVWVRLTCSAFTTGSSTSVADTLSGWIAAV